MKCSSCGSGAEKEWRFCPKCGSPARRSFFDLGSIFSKMRKDMQEMSREIDRGFERDIEAVDISPFFRKPAKARGSGFTIRIVSGTGRKPRVEVKTFGNVDREKIQTQLESQLGYKPKIERPAVERPVPAGMERPEPRKELPAPRKELPAPRRTEEPATEVKRMDSRVVVDMVLPGVESEGDIEISELESSVEVRAAAGDKAYFKILTKPEEFSLAEKRFGKGRLHLEFA